MKKKEIKKYSNVLGIDLGGASRNGLALYSNKDKKLLYHKTIKRYEASSNLEHRNNVIMEMKTINEEYGISNYGSVKYTRNEIYWIGYIYRYFVYTYELSSAQVYKIVQPKELRGLFLP